MTKGISKAESLKNAVTRFEDSDKMAGDYVALLATASLVTRQGSGLAWPQVHAVISATLAELYS